MIKLICLICVYINLTVASAQIFSGSHSYEAKEYFSDLSQPWAITSAPDGRFFVTEKMGNIIVIKDGIKIATIKGIPQDLVVIGQGGLMDIELDPNFTENSYIYLSYTTNKAVRAGAGAQTRVSRFKLIKNHLREEKILLQGGHGFDGAHFGCRLAFDQEGRLYATFGERHQKNLAQDLNFLNGKVVRINSDGTIPSDNPFIGRTNIRPEIYSFGHRNPQGIGIHPLANVAVISEHGPSGYDAELPIFGPVGKADEVNWLLSGRNYGWPTIFGDPSILPWTDNMFHFRDKQNVVMPIQEFSVPDGIAPSGAAFYTGEKFQNWRNDFFVAALRGYLMRLKISKNGKLIESEKLMHRGFSRVRDVVSGVDGLIYVIASGKIIQLRPSANRPDSSEHENEEPEKSDDEIFRKMSKITNDYQCAACHRSEFSSTRRIPFRWRSDSIENSPILLAVESGRMPAFGPKLTEADIATVRTWLERLTEQ